MEAGGEILGNNIVLFWPSFIAATLIALVHLLTPHFRFMHQPGNPWVPASAGIALAYVFMDIFPHLATMQSKRSVIIESNVYGFLTNNVYLVCLIGFAVYLGVVLWVNRYFTGQGLSENSFGSAPVPIKIEYASLGAYSFLIGYLLSEQITHRPEPVLLFGAAMAIHFAGIDSLMHERVTNLYERFVRFMLVACVYTGWITGVVLEIADATLALWYAFLAGGLIVVAAVNELPSIQNRRQYGAFIIGAGVFSAFILAIERFD
jgi:hypothetical protein